MAATECSVPISTLRAGAFQLPWGSSIYAKVVAYNLYGSSAESSVGNGATILTNPDAPINVLEDESQRTSNSITFTWEDGAQDGGASIDNYRVSSDQSTGTYVVLSSGVTAKSYTATTLTAGQTYSFKIESKNSFGYSSFSEIAVILCATIPSKPSAPSTYVVGGDVIVTWVKPKTNGLAITSYTVYVQQADTQYGVELTNCDGSDPAIVVALQCAIPLTTLITAPFNLAQGASVNARVVATNAYGDSEISIMGSGATIVLVPDAAATLVDDTSVTT